MADSASRAPADVSRLLRYVARTEVEKLEQGHAPVEPVKLAERVVFAYHHLVATRAHRAELIAAIAGYIRQLRSGELDDDRA